MSYVVPFIPAALAGILTALGALFMRATARRSVHPPRTLSTTQPRGAHGSCSAPRLHIAPKRVTQ
jgi:hypothetical protein